MPPPVRNGATSSQPSTGTEQAIITMPVVRADSSR
jgi:hypothetical protein